MSTSTLSKTILESPWIRVLCHLLAAMPLLWGLVLVFRSASGDPVALGADPAKTLMSYLGEWAIRGIAITLAISPLQRRFPKLRLIRYRRAWGLWAFAYVCIHFSLYTLAIAGLDLTILLEDIKERPFIILGMSGFLLLIPLAVTSTRGWQRRLGPGWRKLHRLVYLVAIVALIHFFLQVRSNYLEFVLMALVLVPLLLIRLPWQRWRTSVVKSMSGNSQQ